MRRDPSEGGAPLYRSSQTSRSALRRRCALSAPLAVFCSVHHVDMRQCHRCGADVEIRRRRAEQFSWASMGFHRGSLQVGLCTPTALTTSPHTLDQLTFPSSHPVSPQGSLPHRLACLDQRARVTLWAVGVQPSLVVHGVLAEIGRASCRERV